MRSPRCAVAFRFARLQVEFPADASCASNDDDDDGRILGDTL